MVTLDKIKSAIRRKKDKTYFERFINEIRQEKDESIKVTRANIESDLYKLRDLLTDIKKEDWCPDELVSAMHNLICIAPEEQYRFFVPIKKLYNSLPLFIKDQRDIAYAIKQLKRYTAKDLKEKMQLTDLSQYLCTYRLGIYKYGVPESDKQLAIEEDLHNRLVSSIEFVKNKRETGLQTADILIKLSEQQK